VTQPAKRRATYEDVLRASPELTAEVIDGELYTQPRPASFHALARTTLQGELHQPFGRGRGGPGGWVLLYEPELHLEGDILVPDLAGWRRERMPTVPDAPFFTLAPDWLAEVLSPSTRRHDRIRKLPVYARVRVAHVWILDPEDQTLEVFRLDGETYRLVATFANDEKVRAEPFDAMELELGVLWAR
jgi:Uma2 family endonuclease